MKRPAGFVVIERCEEWEQVLALELGAALPPLGVLTWAEDDGKPPLRTVFATRKAARAAIERTEHYRLAWGDAITSEQQVPEKALCFIQPVAFAPAEKEN